MKAKYVLAATAVSAVLALFVAGCGSSEKIAARVNNDKITEKEFSAHVLRVDGVSLFSSARSGGPSRAGEFALNEMILDRLILQAAAQKQATPTDPQIKEFIAFAKKYPTSQAETMLARDRSDADWLDFARRQVAVRNLALKAITVTPEDIQRKYDDPIFQKKVKVPDAYRVRIIFNRTKAKSDAVLAALKKLPFETVALTQSEDQTTKQNSGDAGFLPETTMAPALREAVMKLKPGEYTKSSIAIPPSNAPVGTPPFYVVAQFIEKRPGAMPALATVKLLIENEVIREKDTSNAVGSYLSSTIRDITEHATIQINIKEYEGLVAKLKSSVSGGNAAPAPGGAVPPTAVPAP